MDEERRTTVNSPTASGRPGDASPSSTRASSTAPATRSTPRWRPGPWCERPICGREPWISPTRTGTSTSAWRCGLARSGPDRQGDVGRARSNGRHAGPKDRSSAGRRQLRVGSLSHCGDAARHSLPSRRRAPASAELAGGRRRRSTPCSRIPLAAQPTGPRPTGSGRGRQQRSGHPRLRGALDRPRRRLLQGPRHQRCRPHGGPGHVSHLQPAHRELAAPRDRHARPGDGEPAPDGGRRRRSERRRSRLRADGPGLRRCRVPGGRRPRLRGSGPARRVHRAHPSPPSREAKAAGG